MFLAERMGVMVGKQRRLRFSEPIVCIALALAAAGLCMAQAHTKPGDSQASSGMLRVAVAGSEPFVVNSGNSRAGISVEIWQAVADHTGLRYHFQPYDSVPEALAALHGGAVDAVVGPVSVTAARAREVAFSQPYYQSSLSILSGTSSPSIWQRVQPFFSPSFFIAIGILLFVLAVVGTLIWLAERKTSAEEFPYKAGPGIANGIWLAVVTMTTVGYGDRAPKTVLGRVITGIWMVVSLITATSLIAGIASTLTLTGMQTNIVSTAEQLHGKTIAVVPGTPGAGFAQSYGAKLVNVSNIQEGFDLVHRHSAQAMVFDRPQLLYYKTQQHKLDEAISKAEYEHQGYAFAFAQGAPLVHTVNISLLRLEESGRAERIVREWLGDQAQD